MEVTCKQVNMLLEKGGLPILVLKGPHVAAIVYDDSRERIFCDLDVLVAPKDFHRAANVLLMNGYSVLFTDPKRLFSQKADYQLQFRSPQGILVELHRALADKSQFYSDVKGFFVRAEEFSFGELKCRGLATEDLLLHLCLHLGKRHFMTCGRKHLQDIALLVEKRSVDWDAFLARTRRARCRIISYYSLMAARLQYHAKIPSNVFQKLKPKVLRRRFIERYFDPSAFPLYRLAQNPSGLRDRFVNLLLLDKIPTMMRSMVSFSVRAMGDFFLRWRLLRNLWLANHPLKKFLDMRDRRDDARVSKTPLL